MSHLFEVRCVHNSDPSPMRWRIISSQFIDTEIYVIINDRIRRFNLVATSITEEESFVYEIVFHRSTTRGHVKRMFPDCVIEPICQVPSSRILVMYDREDNCYRPFDDPSM